MTRLLLALAIFTGLACAQTATITAPTSGAVLSGTSGSDRDAVGGDRRNVFHVILVTIESTAHPLLALLRLGQFAIRTEGHQAALAIVYRSIVKAFRLGVSNLKSFEVFFCHLFSPARGLQANTILS